MAPTTDNQQLLNRPMPPGEPITAYESKMVMLRAERHDEIEVVSITTELMPDETIPEKLTVVRRTEPYFGTKLLLECNGRNFLLTAPGPDTQLLLWKSDTTDNYRTGWDKLAEIEASFSEQIPQYDLCPYCGEPMKTLEHERMAGFEDCPNSG